jgi:hypothetical protein
MNDIVKAYLQLSGKKKGFLLQEDVPRLFIRNKMYDIEIAHSKVFKKGHIRIVAEFIQTDDKGIMFFCESKWHFGLESALILYEIPLRNNSMYGLFYMIDDKIYDVMFAEESLYKAVARVLTERSKHIENPDSGFEKLFEQMNKQHIESLNELYLSGKNIE